MVSIFEKDYKYCPTCKDKLTRSEVDGDPLLNCKKCGFVFWNNPKPVVSTLINKDGKILMLKRAVEPFKDFWVLPGGFVKYEEEPEQAAMREIREEIGLSVKVGQLVEVYRIGNDPRGAHIDIIYSTKVVSGFLKLESEVFREFDWFNSKSLPDKIAYGHREVIEKWIQNNINQKDNL